MSGKRPRPPILPAGEPNPWQTLNQKTVYANPWIDVRQDDVIQPDGRSGLYGVVQPTHTALGVIPLDEQEYTYLVGQYRYPLNCYSWEIPEGGGDPEKDPQQEAARELKEETGLVAASWRHLATLHTSNCFTSEKAELYLATDLSQHEHDPDPTEQLKVLRLPFEQAYQAVLNGEITDALSAAGILMVHQLLN